MARAKPGKIVCVGRNYAAHARELGNPLPAWPLIFFKPPSAVISAGEPIVLPDASSQVEFEGEIAVVLGSSIYRASPEEAVAAVAGITCANDVTARDLQKSDGQWARAKGFDTFCPIGEVVDSGLPLAELEIVTRVNGEERQRGRSSEMIFPIPDLLAWISAVMTLESGDVILTGTPEGVGALAAGDVVEVEIPGVVSMSNPVIRGA